MGAVKREQVLDRVKTYEQARKKALENTDTNLRNAKAAFEKSGNLENLEIVNRKLQGK